jgi:hypothetical protein
VPCCVSSAEVLAVAPAPFGLRFSFVTGGILLVTGVLPEFLRPNRGDRRKFREACGKTAGSPAVPSCTDDKLDPRNRASEVFVYPMRPMIMKGNIASRARFEGQSREDRGPEKTMQFIPNRIHGVIDYLTAGLLILAPWLFGFANGGAAQWVPIILGIVIAAYSLMTDYELSVAKSISMPIHLGLDIGGGILLAASPWLFGFADVIVWPHLVVGIMEIGVAACTRRRSRSTATA